MAVTTMESVRVEKPLKRGFFSSLIEKIAAAQMDKARALAREYLLALSDADLAELGHTREEVRRWGRLDTSL